MGLIKTCAIVGSTPNEFDFGFDELHPHAVRTKAVIVNSILEIISGGCEEFITSLSQGVELWAAEACAAMIRTGCPIKLTGVPICEDQAARWHPELHDRYYRVIGQCTELVTPTLFDPDDPAAECFVPESFSEDYILENADMILVVGKNIDERTRKLLADVKTPTGVLRVC